MIGYVQGGAITGCVGTFPFITVVYTAGTRSPCSASVAVRKVEKGVVVPRHTPITRRASGGSARLLPQVGCLRRINGTRCEGTRELKGALIASLWGVWHVSQDQHMSGDWTCLGNPPL